MEESGGGELIHEWPSSFVDWFKYIFFFGYNQILNRYSES